MNSPNIFAKAAQLMEKGKQQWCCNALKSFEGHETAVARFSDLFKQEHCHHFGWLSCSCAYPDGDEPQIGEEEQGRLPKRNVEDKILALCFAAAMEDTGDL